MGFFKKKQKNRLKKKKEGKVISMMFSNMFKCFEALIFTIGKKSRCIKAKLTLFTHVSGLIVHNSLRKIC